MIFKPALFLQFEFPLFLVGYPPVSNEQEVSEEAAKGGNQIPGKRNI